MRSILRPRTFVLLYFIFSTGGILWLIVNYDSLCPQEFHHGNDKHPHVIDDNLNVQHMELLQREELLRKERRTFQEMSARLRRQHPVAGIAAANETIQPSISTNKSIPTIYAVTPTYARPVQKAELTRISQTFMHVGHLHWIVVEDADNKTSLVGNFLRSSGVKFTHLNCKTPEPYKLSETDPSWLKPRGVEQRNTAIDWLMENIDPRRNPGVVYFADDDNTYALQVFEEMRYTVKVSMWPVGLVGGQMYESPSVDGHGRVTGWNVGWQPQRPFPMDMAGFAINLRLFKESAEKVRFSAMAKRGHLESSLLVGLVTLKDLEPKADMCTKIYVWHTRTEKPKLKYKIQSDVHMEV